MEVKIVLGLLFGDEGKGNTVQWLCKKALEEGKRPCVVRFSGGPQAGHTIRHNGVTHVCSSYGSGVLLGVPTLYMGGLIDPLCVENERKVLEKKGVSVPPLYAAPYVSLITPYDVADQLEWAKNNPNRTCGKGVMSAVLRDKNLGEHCQLRVEDLYSGPFFGFKSEYMMEYYSEKGITADKKIVKDWIKAGLNLYKDFFKYDIDDFNVFIFEGTQGLLLDVDNGFYPYTTSTRVGLNGVPVEYLKNAEVYLVSRTYLTRHGEMGLFEKQWFKGREKKVPASKLETNLFNEHQGEFLTAKYHPAPYKCAVQRHCLDNLQKKYGLKMNLVVTHTDVDYYEAGFPKGDYSFFINGILRVLEESLVLQNIYTSNNPDSNFELYDTRDS